MIATGLCLMGGCFAMDNGAAVDAYWPAAVAEFSPEVQERYVNLMRVTIWGGDTRQEFCSFKGVYQNKTGVGEWLHCAGMKYEAGSMAGGVSINAHGVETSTFPACLYARFGTGSHGRVLGYEPREIFVSALNTACRFEVTDGEVVEANAFPIAFADNMKRDVDINSAVTVSFQWFEYGCELTGVHFCINAMKSAGGASALFSDYDATLVEV